jgi:dynein heavy chain
LNKYCKAESLNDNYQYSGSGIYYTPPDTTIQGYRDYIDTFPLNDDPEIFGMHYNANITAMQNDSQNNIDTILDIQPRLIGGGGGMTPDEIVIAKSAELLEQLPDLLDQREGLPELFTRNEQGLIPSLSTVVLQEMEKFNRLLKVMKRSLIDIEQAIKGYIVMSETLDAMYVKIQNNQVPLNWSKVAYPSLKPLSSWYKDMLQRVKFMYDWLMEGNPNSYWLSGMIFPQGFMTGVLQTHARKHKIAIDRLSFVFKYMDEEGQEEIEDKPEDGVYIYGLFMDGARWDREEQRIAD